MNRKYPPVILHHYIRSIYRVLIFIAFSIAFGMRIISANGFENTTPIMDSLVLLKQNSTQSLACTDARIILNVSILIIIWIVYMAEMILRHLPLGIESPGCQKQFGKFFVPVENFENKEIIIEDNRAVIPTALCWIVVNLIFGIMYLKGFYDADVMMLLALLYSLGDMICILIWCPFQKLFLKNKCCSTCRIYNWDYPMLFTPLMFVGGLYSLSLSIMALSILVRWEFTFKKYPERFSKNTNAYLNCANCRERVCKYRRFP